MIKSKWILNEICIVTQTNEYGFYGMLHSNWSRECVVHHNMQFQFGVCSTQLCTSHLYKPALHDKTIIQHKTATNQHSRPNLFHETLITKNNRILKIWLLYFKFMLNNYFWLYQKGSYFSSLSCLIYFYFFLSSSLLPLVLVALTFPLVLWPVPTNCFVLPLTIFQLISSKLIT